MIAVINYVVPRYILLLNTYRVVDASSLIVGRLQQEECDLRHTAWRSATVAVGQLDAGRALYAATPLLSLLIVLAGRCDGGGRMLIQMGMATDG